jgi:molybdenum cofactor cytidylyltransferase/nicotine blue oxidoreductase
MGGPKSDLVLDGVRLVDRAVAAVGGAGCRPVVAVVRAGTTVPGARVAVNADPDRGMRSSLELALAALADGSQPVPDAIAVLLVDLPGIGVDAVRAVCAAWRPGRISVGRVAGRRTHPTVMAPALWRRALALAGPDEGARRYLAERADLIDEVDVAADPADLDTPEDLRRWAGG